MATFNKGEVAIITGASSGIGAGTAVVLARKGLKKLCLTGRKVSGLEETKRMCIQECGGTVSDEDILLVDGDITNEEVCSRIVSATVEKFGRIDVLVNNAGFAPFGSVGALPVSKFDDVTNTNVRSVIVLTQLCIPHLKAQKGAIVNVSSFLGLQPNPNLGYYCMTKAALDMFTKCLSLELGPEGVRVNSVNPGFIPTQIGIRQGLPEDAYSQAQERHSDKNPLRRCGTVEEVGNVIAFLASNQSSYMSGTLLPVDGGFMNALP